MRFSNMGPRSLGLFWQANRSGTDNGTRRLGSWSLSTGNPRRPWKEVLCRHGLWLRPSHSRMDLMSWHTDLLLTSTLRLAGMFQGLSCEAARLRGCKTTCSAAELVYLFVPQWRPRAGNWYSYQQIPQNNLAQSWLVTCQCTSYQLPVAWPVECHVRNICLKRVCLSLIQLALAFPNAKNEVSQIS